MGKQSKAQEAEARRKYMDELRRKEAEKQKQQNRLMWQILIAVLAVIVIAATIPLAISLGGSKAGTENAVKMEELDLTAKDISLFTETEAVTDFVKINVSYIGKYGVPKTGDVIVRLFAEVAPETVKNFQNLVKSDFYDGLTFHRVVEGFMIQGGDPKGDGSGNSATTIKGEFTSNGFVNNLKHNRGVISMARQGGANNSASCQFFIVHEESEKNHASLDGNYASFGIVVYGMETVDGIAETEVQIRNQELSSPLNRVTINSISFVKMK